MDRVYEITPAEQARLDNNYIYHAPRSDQPPRYEAIRSVAKDFATACQLRCPASRELSLALTKIEEAVMWANAAIARNEKDAT